MTSIKIFWGTTPVLKCMFSGLDDFVQYIHPLLGLHVCSNFSSYVDVLDNLPDLCWIWFYIHEVRGLQLFRSKLPALSYLTESTYVIAFDPRTEIDIRHFHEKYRRWQIAWLNCWSSFPWHYRIPESMLNISTFVLVVGNVWNVNWIISPSIIFAMSLLYSRCPFHLS